MPYNASGGIVLHKDHGRRTKEFMKYCHQKGCINVVLDEEAVTFHPDKIFEKVRIDDESFNYINLFIFLDDSHYGLYERLGKIHKLKKFCIAGNPRFDFGLTKLSKFAHQLALP